MKLSRKLSVATLAVAGLGIIATGCGNAQSSQSNSQNASSSQSGSGALHGKSGETYYMITFLSGISYWKGVYAGMQSAAKDLGVKTVYTGAPKYNINQEVSTLRQVIAKKPAGILISSMNAKALTPEINKAVQAGIPVISFDSDAPNSQRYAYLGTSNYEAGQKAAGYLGKQLNGQGQVAVVSTPGELNLDQRVNGFKAEMKSKYPNINVVAVENGKSQQIQTSQVTSTLLQKYPNLKGIFATEASEGTGAATAVKQAKKTSQVKIVSFDTDTSTLNAIKSGTISATIAQGTWNMGFWGLMDAFMVHHNLLHPVKNWQSANVDPLPPSVDTGVTVITNKNVKYYLNQK